MVVENEPLSFGGAGSFIAIIKPFEFSRLASSLMVGLDQDLESPTGNVDPNEERQIAEIKISPNTVKYRWDSIRSWFPGFQGNTFPRNYQY